MWNTSMWLGLAACVLSIQLGLTLCNPMDCSPPGSSVHRILQARILEWVVIFFFRCSSWPRDWTQVSYIAGRFSAVWATREASGSDGIPTELLEILKDSPVKCCTQHVRKFGKLSSGHGTGKGQFSLQSQRRAIPKNVQTTVQLHSFHMLPEILQARLQQYVNWKLPDV